MVEGKKEANLTRPVTYWPATWLATICLFLAIAFPSRSADVGNGETLILYVQPLAIEIRHGTQTKTAMPSHVLYLVYEESKSFKKENASYESKMRPGIYRSRLDRAKIDDTALPAYANLLEDIITHQRKSLYALTIDLTTNSITSLALVP